MSESVRNAITRRIATQRLDLLITHGFDRVTDEIELEASFVGDVEEIGSSDVSCWVKEIERRLRDDHIPKAR